MEAIINNSIAHEWEQSKNYGNGYGYGSGWGYGSGCGSGWGYGSGCGSGKGSGSGADWGWGNGYGNGWGSGADCGYGNGYGKGNGYGYGSGSGSGKGYGSGYNIKSYNDMPVFAIDGLQTIITSAHRDTAKGYIIKSDLTLNPCFIVKQDGHFAHGKTLHEAFQALQEKLFDNSTEADRLTAFRSKFPSMKKAYSARELFSYHHILTGSCLQGREIFCKNHNISLNKDKFTIPQFIELTKNEYGGSTIQKIMTN